MIESKKVSSELNKGFIEFAVLLILEKKPHFVGEILELLTQADLLTVEGTLYPLLSRLRSQELVEYFWEESRQGPPRKYYSLTQLGRELLLSYEESWEGLVKTLNFLKQKNEQ